MVFKKKIKYFEIGILISILTLIPTFIYAKILTGTIISIFDGDTFALLDKSKSKYIVKLSDIEAPEKEQTYGLESMSFSFNLISFTDVSVLIKDVTQEGYLIGEIITVDSQNVALELVNAGLAWLKGDYDICNKIWDADNKAKKNKIGLWSQLKPIPPWKWRESRAKQNNGGKDFGIYLLKNQIYKSHYYLYDNNINNLELKGEPLWNLNDFIFYNWKKHSFLLTADAELKAPFDLKGHLVFVVVAKNKRIYMGDFISAFRSDIHMVPNIPIIHPFRYSDRGAAFKNINSHFIINNNREKPDLLNNNEIKEVFEKAGKLK